MRWCLAGVRQWYLPWNTGAVSSRGRILSDIREEVVSSSGEKVLSSSGEKVASSQLVSSRGGEIVYIRLQQMLFSLV